MAETLFNRDIAVTVGPLRIEPRNAQGFAQPILKMTFKVTKTLNSNPNEAELAIWNLKDSSRSKIQAKNIPVLIEAGYLSFTSQLFQGDMTFANTVRERSDWITRLEAGDGTKKFKSSRINESFKPGAAAGQVLRTVGESLGVDLGNLGEKADADGGRSVLKQFISGRVLSGKSSDVMDDVAKSLGLNWSIQDGKLQLLGKKETTKDPAIILKPSSGLVGSPEAGEGGIVKARSLLNGRLFPGRKVKLESVQVEGTFRVEKATHSGDTWGGDWYSDLELKEVG